MTAAVTERDPTAPATIALAALTAAIILGFIRLFATNEFVVPALLVAGATHLVAWWCRRAGIGTAPGWVFSIGAGLLITVWIVLGHTTWYGVPTGETLQVGGEVLREARGTFADVKSPAPVLDGFLLATLLALTITAATADWAAFRAGAAIEACVPALSIFLFTAYLGTPRHRALAFAAFVAGVLTFLLTQQLIRQRRSQAWFGGKSSGGPSALARAAAGVGALAIGAGLLIGPNLPTADDPAIIKLKGRGRHGPSNRTTISPLVDIRGRLVDFQNVEVFTVQSQARAYWRLTGLDIFDGQAWKSEDNYRDAGDDLDRDVPSNRAAFTSVTQRFSISALASIWLPAAYRPEAVSGLDDVSFAPASASLITAQDTTDGLTYRVDSSVPDFTPQDLDTAPALAPTEVVERYISLPANLSTSRLAALSQQITQRATTPYQKARALQDFFHGNGFRYDLRITAGHDGNALERFLFQSRRGYCEQFAGAYGVLARLAGLPTRIAVGFTPGTLEADGMYHVRDEHAHAWPEVYLHGFGWVAFEPTPGRGAPGAEDYTGRPESQDASGDTQQATTVPPTTTPTTGAPSTATTEPDIFGQDDVVETETQLEREPLWTGPRILMAVVALLLVAWLIGLPLLHRRRRSRRRSSAGSVSARVLASWADAHEVLTSAGVPRRASETLAEYARRAGRSAGLVAEANSSLRSLAGDAAVASYAPDLLDADAGARAEEAAKRIVTTIEDQVGWFERAKWSLDPRPLVGATRD